MPFTLAHPLYAAPLKLVKPAWFSLTGLILGSMSPDYEYFIALEPFRSIGHTHLGLLLHALPLSVLLALLFHFVVKEPLARHLPNVWGLDARATALVRRHEWRLTKPFEWIVFLPSVALGFYSHILVDAFTHQSAFFVQRIGVLRMELAGIPVYKLLQYGLSLAGLTVQGIILIYLLKRINMGTIRAIAMPKPGKLAFWLIVAATTIIIVLLKLLFASSGNYIGMLVVSSISGCMSGIIVAASYDKLKNHIAAKSV